MMISRDITIDGITYTVSATTLRGLEEAVVYLTQSLADEKRRLEADRLELELNQSFDEVLEKIDSGELQLPSQVDQPDQESEAKPAKPEPKKRGPRKK
jgi:hypothetical protein